MTIEDPPLSAPWLPIIALATSQLVGNNKKFDVSGIF